MRKQNPEWIQEQALNISETAGARMADLDYAIERIHYEPSACTEEDLEDLVKIKEMIEMAAKLAEHIAARIEG